MATSSDTLAALLRDRDNGQLAGLCARFGVDLLVLFGSARTSPGAARDVDVAYSFQRGTRGDDVAFVTALGERYGDRVDAMPLDKAGPVARYEALCRGEVLVLREPDKFALSQMKAFGEYCDTAPYRRLQLEVMSR